MATETSVLAPGTTAATSTVITVGAGATAIIGIYATTGNSLPTDVEFVIKVDTPGIDTPDSTLTNQRKFAVVPGPADYYVDRPAYTGTPYGVYYSIT